MSTKRTILFRLSNLGEPVNNENISNGIFTLPPVELPKSYKPGDVIFEIHFQLNAASKVTKNGTFLTNIPTNYKQDFDRHKHASFPIHSSFHQDITIVVPIYKPGAYNYYITYDDENDSRITTDKYYFNVLPNLTIDGQYVAFNSINVQTVISKWIGPLLNWDKFFGIVAGKGYNMIHFTPLQERGESDSPYSIYDQLKYDHHIFKDNKSAPDEIQKILHKHKLLSLTDVVWNHTANNSDWLREYPDAGYNATTAPHLTPAIELDAALLEFSLKLEEFDLPVDIKDEKDLKKIIEGIQHHVLDKLKLWEFYVFSRKLTLFKMEQLFQKRKQEITPIKIPKEVDIDNLKQLSAFILKTTRIHDKHIISERFGNKLDIKKFLGILFSVFHINIDFDTIATKAGDIIDKINAEFYAMYDDDIKSIKTQISDRIKYMRLSPTGPKLGPVTSKNPLTENYFTTFVDNKGNRQALANNGWIWGGNPLVDFASDQSRAYLRREVIVWGDCVKLRYGDKYEDSPYLWDRMIQYTQESAKTYNGFRIDNCHSTPLHVGERLLDEARNVNPNLYVIAELFSGSEEMDKIFVERLGINTLIREAMQPWDVKELSRLVHKHGGRPIGSLTWLPLDDFTYPAENEPIKNKYLDAYTELEIPTVLTSHPPHALFMDCTHDNETPYQKRTVEDTLPNAALVAFCSSAIGSVYGYDECYPHILNVVHEHRQYDLNSDNGIGKVKAKLHKIRKDLALESEDISRDHEMYIHHEGQYITIQRYNARTGKGWFLIARTKFSKHLPEQILSPVVLTGAKVKHEFSYTLKKTGKFERDEKIITGIPVKVEELKCPKLIVNSHETIIEVDESFIPGSISVFSTEIPGVDVSLDNFVKEGAIEASIGLDLYDLNALLYKSSPEELDASAGKENVYTLPGYGPLVYAGLEGWNSALKHVIWSNNLGDPICDHLRQGEWALDYIVNRLDKYVAKSKNLGRFQDWLRSRFNAAKKAPYFLRPHYFALIVGIAYEAARFRAIRGLGIKIQQATNFVQRLGLTSIQMVGYMNNTSLKPTEQVACMAAGLPHFSSDYMRCWGRDVFIAFRGLLLVPERYEDAKQHILAFGQTLKHGLMPNLLDAGRNPRYNARDAAWFYLQAIQEYVKYVPNGVDILDEKVKRRFPLDDTYVEYTDPRAFSYESSIREIIFEILQRHAAGIKYREANAGPNLDSQMKDEGFNVEVHIDWETGLVHGGSQFNCGTWMDKMGESEKAKNKGVPGTPRDGAAIELQGLMKSALRFVNKLHKQGKFEYKEVKRSDGSTISLKDWEQLIQENFEKCFYIPADPKDDSKYNVDPSLIHRRGIYKDLYKSGKPYEDYQLRPNFSIAMCAAPELFSPEKALGALRLADKVIRGPVGMRTLDPDDWNYHPYYNNSEDSDNFATSKGRNYHQGPEWVWNLGYFLRAFLLFHYIGDSLSHTKSGDPSDKILTELKERLQGNIKWIKATPWAGLTELSNKDGAICHDSSPTQAWSSSCLLDLYYDLWNDEHYHKH